MCCCFPNKVGEADPPVCPVCERGRLFPEENLAARCGRCGYILGGGMLATLRQIDALPDTPSPKTR